MAINLTTSPFFAGRPSPPARIQVSHLSLPPAVHLIVILPTQPSAAEPIPRKATVGE